MKTNQKGFSGVVILIIVAVIALVGAAGWYVYDKKKTDKPTASSDSSSSDKKTLTKADETKDWTKYTSTSGSFSLKYPPTWLRATNEELCSEDLLLLGTTAATVGKCASEFGGQMSIAAVAGNYVADSHLQSTYVAGITTTSVTVDGVSGEKQTGTAKAPPADDLGIGGLPENTVIVLYIFYANGKTYTASYHQQPTYPDVLSLFNTLVTDTLQFN